MSVRINKNLPFAVLALGIEVALASPVVEGLLNDFTVEQIRIAQVDDSGRCIMLADIKNSAGATQVRPVATSSGDVKLFTDLASAQALILRAKFTLGASVTFVRKEKSSPIGDPVAALKKLYKAFKLEKMKGVAAAVKIAASIQAGTALGYNHAVGTPEAIEFADYMAKAQTVAESVDFCTGRIAALAASLTAVGIDPLTVV